MKKNTLIIIGVAAAALLFIAMRKKKSGGMVIVPEPSPISEEQYNQATSSQSDAGGGSSAPTLSRQIETLSSGRKPLTATKKIYSGGKIKIVPAASTAVKKLVKKVSAKKMANRKIGFPELY
jgi:hypothetical protein